jgi:hypothetical protein
MNGSERRAPVLWSAALQENNSLGLQAPRHFLAGLAFKTFHSTQVGAAKGG